MFHFNFITVSQLNPSNGMERRLFFIVEIEGDEILMRASERFIHGMANGASWCVSGMERRGGRRRGHGKQTVECSHA